MGGVVGCNIGTITNCVCSGTGGVSVSGGRVSDAGGIAGYNYGTVTNCAYSASNGVFTYDGLDSNTAGGVVGINIEKGKITNCAYSGDGGVSASGGSQSCAGGLVGSNGNGKITNSAYSGDGRVSVSGGNPRVGGLVGYNDPSGTIMNCGWLKTAASEGVDINENLTSTDIVSLDAEELESITTPLLLDETTVTEGASAEANFAAYPGGPEKLADYLTVTSADTGDNTVATAAAGSGSVTVNGLKAGVTEILASVKINTYKFKDKTISEDAPLETELASIASVTATPKPHSGGSSGCETGTAAAALLAQLQILYRKKR